MLFKLLLAASFVAMLPLLVEAGQENDGASTSTTVSWWKPLDARLFPSGRAEYGSNDRPSGLGQASESWEWLASAESKVVAREAVAQRPERSAPSTPSSDENDVLVPTIDEDTEPVPPPRTLAPFLPLWGDAVRAQGIELPLPLGFSVIYNHVSRDIDVDDIKLSVGGGFKRSVRQFLNVDSDSSVDVVVGALDAWLLPFLNVRAYAGHQRNQSNVKVAVSVPRPGPLPPLNFVVKDDGTLEGPVYGIGLTLAGGYEDFFATAVVDFAYADLDEFDSRFEGRVYGVRAGWNGRVAEMPTRLWTGFSYWDTATTIEGSVGVPGIGQVRFDVDQGPEHPWNGVLGFGLSGPHHIEVFAEYGFNFGDVQAFAGGLTIRF